MKRAFKLENLDCANCAAKMETAINKLEKVDHATINFMSQKLTLEADESVFQDMVEEAQKQISRVERNCKIVR